MSRYLFPALALLLAVALPSTLPADSAACDTRVKEYYGSKYYKQCKCKDFSYPRLSAQLANLGVATKSDWVACSTFDGEEWCVCGVKASWREGKKPSDKNRCKSTRDRTVALAEEAGVGISYAWLDCR